MYNFALYSSKITGFATVTPYYETLEIEYSIDKGTNKTVKLNGDLIFKGVDVDVINLHDITDTITVAIGRVIGRSNELIYKGEFTLRDCEVDADNNEIKLTITTADYYTQFLDVYEKEVNLADLPIKKIPFKYDIPEVMQVYVVGDDYLTNIYANGLTFEQPCGKIEIDTSPNDLWDIMTFINSEDVRIYKFTRCQTVFYSNEIGGQWNGLFDADFDFNDSPFVYYFKSIDNRYRIDRVATGKNIWRWDLYEYEGSGYTNLLYSSNSLEGDLLSISLYTFTHVVTGATLRFPAERVILTRILTNNPTGATAHDSDDILHYNNLYSYQKVFSGNLNTTLNIKLENFTQTTPNQFPTNDIGKYFRGARSGYTAFGSRVWSEYYLLFSNSDLGNKDNQGTKEIEIQGYRFQDAFQVLLNHFGLPLTFVSEMITTGRFLSGIWAFTHLSNLQTRVSKGNNLATSNVISLARLIEYFEKQFNASWDIYNKKLRVEHKYFYQNGLSYSVTPNVIDLTSMNNRRLDMNVVSNANIYKYDYKDYETRVLEQQNALDVFKQSTIQLNFTTKKEERITIDTFTTDFYYLISSNLRADGFFSALLDSSTNKIVNYTFTANSKTYTNLINGYFSLSVLARVFYRYNEYGSVVVVDGVNRNVIGGFYAKEQEVEYLDTDYTPSSIKEHFLRKTELGNGFVKKIVVNLLDNIIKIELLHVAD